VLIGESAWLRRLHSAIITRIGRTIMSRRRHFRGVIVGIVALLSLQARPGASPPAFSQDVSQLLKAALKERDRLSEQTKTLQAGGKLSEAITSAKAMLAIERKVLPAGHDDILGSLDWLARMYIQQGDFAEATAARQEALDALRKRLGQRHWRVTDARLALD
jgi:hypothetical protein